MSLDWALFFQRSPHLRTAYKTLFDAPPEKGEKKEERRPKTLFEAPPEEPSQEPQEAAPALSIFDKPPGAKPGKAPPKAPEEPSEADLWEQFLVDAFGPDGGKFLTWNTNKETQDKYPKVQVNTLLKSDKAYAEHMRKLFEAWKQKREEEGWSLEGHSKGMATEEAKKVWPSQNVDEIDWSDVAFQKAVEMAEGPLKGQKIALIKWLKNDPESPWPPVMGHYPLGPLQHQLGLASAKKLGESLIEHVEQLEKEKAEQMEGAWEGLPGPDDIDWTSEEAEPLMAWLEDNFGSQKGILENKIKAIKLLRGDDDSPWKGRGLKEVKLSIDRLFDVLHGFTPPKDFPSPSDFDWDSEHGKYLLNLMQGNGIPLKDLWKNRVKAYKVLRYNSGSPWKGEMLKGLKDAIDKLVEQPELLGLPKDWFPPQPPLEHFPDLEHDLEQKVSHAFHKAVKGFDGSTSKLVALLGKVKTALGDKADTFDYVGKTLDELITRYDHWADLSESAGHPDGVKHYQGILDSLKAYKKKHEADEAEAEPKEKPKKKVKKEKKPKKKEVTDTHQLAVGDVFTMKSGSKTFHYVVTQAHSNGTINYQRISPTKGLVGYAKYMSAHVVPKKGLEVYDPEQIPKKYHHLPYVADRISGKHEPPEKPPPPPPPPPPPKAQAPKPVKEMPKASPPAPPKGHPVTHVGDVETGDSIMWKDGNTLLVGTVSEAEPGRFFAVARDAKTGKNKGVFVWDAHDLSTLGVGKVSESEIPPTAKVDTLPPEPEAPKHPQAPKVPEMPPMPKKPQVKQQTPVLEGKAMQDDKGLKEGDHITWQTSSGKKYIGRVGTKDDEGKWHVQVLDWDTGDPVSGKIRTFYVSGGKNKFTQRSAHKLTPKMVSSWQEKWKGDEGAVAKWKEEKEAWQAEKDKKDKAYKAKYEVWASKKNKADEEYQKKKKEWDKLKKQLEGDKSAAVHPSTKDESHHLGFQEGAEIKHNHPIVRRADALVPELRAQHKDFLQKTVKQAEKGGDPLLAGSPGTKQREIWDLRSPGEKLMIRSAEKLQKYFQDHVLTEEEHEVLEHALGEWKHDPSYSGAKELMYLSDSYLPHTKSKAVSITDPARAELLSGALAKAMAWNQAVFDEFGIDNMILLRGAKGAKPGGGTYFDDLEQGETLPEEMPYRSLSGFSTSPDTAAGWGNALTAARVPASHVFLSPVTSDKMNWENEWIVASPGTLDWKFVSKGKAYGGGRLQEFDQNKMKLAAFVRLAMVSPEFRRRFAYHLKAVRS